MNDTLIIGPPERTPADLVYCERASRERSLHLLVQDVSARGDGARRAFLAAAFRDTVARYQSASRPERAVAFLRHTVRALDERSVHVETRVDDLRGLGLYFLVEEADAFYLLCARDASARVRVDGTFVPVHGAGAGQRPRGAEEIPIETPRAQHDLFAQTLPDALVLYRLARPRGGSALELLLGGTSADLAGALDALETRPPRTAALASDRVACTVLYTRFDGVHAQRTSEPSRMTGPPRSLRGSLSAALLVAGVAGVAWFATRVDFAKTPSAEDAGGARATQERPTPVMTRDAPEPETTEVAAVAEAKPEDASAARFDLAWERSYSDAVTSSPSPLGDAIVFGARDGKVYALARANGEPVWTHTAGGGVGASPVVRSDAVLVADYSGNVYRLARDDGRTAWKRSLRERVVSTPAVTRERVAVGTTRGNVYALSLETGRVLWKFATRAAVRGGVVAADGLFLVPSNDGKLYALAEDTGRKRWDVALGGPVASTPAVDDERVVIGTAKGHVVALAIADGAKRWSFATRAAVNSALLLHDGRVFAGSGDQHLYCLDAAAGTLVWSFDAGGSVLSRPFVDGDRVLVTSYDGSVYALDAATGALVDRYATEKSIYSSPLVIGDRVFFGNNDGRFFCLSLRD